MATFFKGARAVRPPWRRFWPFISASPALAPVRRIRMVKKNFVSVSARSRHVASDIGDLEASIAVQRQHGISKALPKSVMSCHIGRSGQTLSQRNDARLVGRRASLKLDECDEERVECFIKAFAGGRCLVVEPGTGRQVWFPSPAVRRAMLPEVDSLCDLLAGIPVSSADASSAQRMDFKAASGGTGCSHWPCGAGPSSSAAVPFSVTASASDPRTADLLARPTTMELALATGSYPPPPRVSQPALQPRMTDGAEDAEDPDDDDR